MLCVYICILIYAARHGSRALPYTEDLTCHGIGAWPHTEDLTCQTQEGMSHATIVQQYQLLGGGYDARSSTSWVHSSVPDNGGWSCSAMEEDLLLLNMAAVKDSSGAGHAFPQEGSCNLISALSTSAQSPSTWWAVELGGAPVYITKVCRVAVRRRCA